MNNILEVREYLEHFPALVVVLTTAGMLIIGLIGQILSNKTSVPAIVFYMLFGTILGQYGMGKFGFHIIDPQVFGKDGLRSIIAICVAIIVFEGGLLINLKHLRYNLISVISLITANVFITVLAMAFITSYILKIDWRISLLYASLISVTGPTVIAPILKRIHVSQKVKSILETEGVLVDAVGVITAASVFNYITIGSNANFMDIFNNIFVSLIMGTISGVICTLIAKYIVKRFSPISGEVTRLVVLALAISAYSLGEVLSHESGITAVAIAGIIIGNTDFPHKKSIKEFKGDLTTLSITVVFILLSASLDLELLFELGFKGISIVLILMLFIRPLGVFISTFFEKISFKEKIFIASLGPRGIVAASAATFFSVELESFGFEGGDLIRSMVFMTILITVIVEGSGAKYMAEALKISPLSVLIIGGGKVGRQLALKMKEKGESIIIIENNEAKANILMKEGLYVINTDAKNEKIYKDKVNIYNIKSVITTAEDDWFNLRVCQIIKNLRPEVEVISIINDIKGRMVFSTLGIKTIHLSEAVVTVISELMVDTTPAKSATLNYDNAQT